MNSLRFHHKALIDFDESYKYYEQQSKGLGERFAAEVDERLMQIKLHPLKPKLIKANYRIVFTKIFPFQIVYTFNKTTGRISVLALHHNSKNPKKRFRKF